LSVPVGKVNKQLKDLVHVMKSTDSDVDEEASIKDFLRSDSDIMDIVQTIASGA